MKAGLLKYALFTVFILLLAFCTKTAETNSKEGRIRVYVCSRGCYQYLVSIPTNSADTLFYPVNLPDGYKQLNLDGEKINLTYDDLSSTTQIYYPDKDDIPIPLFLVKNINITNLKASK